MVIINIKSGLGNQMFQYALYLTMKNKGRDAKICTKCFDISEKRMSVPKHAKKYLI